MSAGLYPSDPIRVAMNAVDVGRAEPGAGDFLMSRAAGAKERTLENYARHLGIVRRRSPKALLDLTLPEAQALAARLARELKSGYSLAITVRMFFTFHGRADHAKAFRIRAPRARLPPSKVLMLADVNKLVAAAPSLRDRAFVAVLWETGGRIHEILALTVGDLTPMPSPENGGKELYRVFFRKVKTEGEEHFALLVDAAPHVAAWLKAYPARRDSAPLFPSADRKRWGLQLGYTGARVILDGLRGRAGLRKPTNPHAFRHGRATHLLKMGVPEAHVKKLLGWSPGSSMLGRYSHLIPEDAFNAVLEASGLKPHVRAELEKLEAPVGDIVPAMPVEDTGWGEREPGAEDLDALVADPEVERATALLREALMKAVWRQRGAPQ